MPENEQPYTLDRVVRILILVGGLVAVFALLRYLSDVLVPFAAAVVLAYFLNPLVRKIERGTKGRRGLAVAITLGGLGLVLIAVMWVLVPLMGHQLARFERTLSGLRSSLPEALAASAADTQPASMPSQAVTQPADERSVLGLHELEVAWVEYRRTSGEAPTGVRLRRMLEQVEGTQVGDLVRHAAAFVKEQEFRQLVFGSLKRLAAGGVTVINFAVDLILGATVLIIVVIYLVFLLLDFDAYAQTWKGLLPPKYRDGILGFLNEFEVAMRRYFRGQFVVATTVGVLFSIGFWIIGLPMAVPLGLFIGLLNMVPYLQIVALVPASVLGVIRSVETSGSVLGCLGLVLLIFAVVQVLQDAVIVPRVMGRATGLRPISILLGVFVWGKLLGFFGLLLAIPLTCLCIAYYHRYVLTHPLATQPVAPERP